MKIGSLTLRHGLMLGPMAGYTDTAMRTVCRRLGAEYTVTEMVSAKAVCYKDKKTPLLARISEVEAPCALQLFGSEPEFVAEAAKMLEGGVLGGVAPAAIDINMGCPVPKVAGNGEGSALMKDPALAARIVAATVKATRLPGTVKIRTGWDESSLNAPEVARAVEAAGAALLVVHGRTRKQMYSGEASLREIARVKSAVKIPVVGNGDVKDATTARRMLDETGCDGIMIGRGAVGNPYVFQEITAMLEGREFVPPTMKERLLLALEQLALAAEEKGERTAVMESRKQLAEVIRGTEGAAAMRGRINMAASIEEIREILFEFELLT